MITIKTWLPHFPKQDEYILCLFPRKQKLSQRAKCAKLNAHHRNEAFKENWILIIALL